MDQGFEFLNLPHTQTSLCICFAGRERSRQAVSFTIGCCCLLTFTILCCLLLVNKQNFSYVISVWRDHKQNSVFTLPALFSLLPIQTRPLSILFLASPGFFRVRMWPSDEMLLQRALYSWLSLDFLNSNIQVIVFQEFQFHPIN